MRKSIIALALAVLFTGFATAQEVSFGGWVETKGTLYRTPAEGDAYTGLGINEAGVDIKISGENFGAQFGFGGWHEGEWSKDAAGDPQVLPRQMFVWSDLGTNGLVKLYGGNQMEVIDYSPAPAIGEIGTDIGDNQFGLGMGKYNYQGDGTYTSPKSGLIAEVSTNGLTAAITWSAPFVAPWAVGADWAAPNNGALVEDNNKEAFVINAKYAMEGVGTFFAGYAPKTDDGGLWAAASINAVPGVMADLKFEMAMPKADADKKTVIAANLGYNIEGIANIKTETTYKLQDSSVGNDLAFALQASPVVPVVGLDLAGEVKSNSKADDMAYGLSAKVSKGVGNVGNSLQFAYNSTTADDAKGTTAIVYSINMYY